MSKSLRHLSGFSFASIARFAFTALCIALAVSTLAPPAQAQGATVAVTLRTDPGRPLGTDGGGRLLIYAPNPLELGSSISHWDLTASPDLLMEPSNSTALSFAPLDLTLPAMQDLGWPPGSANITLRIQDPAGIGFNDPALGPQRMAAIQLVAQRWAAVLGSGVEINLGVSFTNLPCSANSGVLAQAGANFIFENFSGAPRADTWYHGALAESLSGQNLSLEDMPAAPNAPDLVAQFNTQIDESCLGSNTGYYYGLDSNVPNGRISFVNVALHEIGHGLGFSSVSTNAQTGIQFEGLPDIYEHNLFDASLGLTWSQMNIAERRTSAVNSGGLVWNGTRANNAAPGLLAPGPVVAINAPSALAGLLQATNAQFGPQLNQAGLSGELVLAVDGSASPSLVCNPVANGGQVAGKIAIIDRGVCNFTVKVKNAQNAGALAVVVVNNVAGPPIPMGGQDPTITIPSVQISFSDGEILRQALTVGVPPAAPSDLAVAPLSGGRSRLTWTDNSDDETGFRVERRRDGAGGFQLRTNTGANVTSFEDSGLIPGATYTYRVRARNAAGNSPFSNNASIVVDAAPAVPDPPANVSAASLSPTGLQVFWDLPATGEESFVVQVRKIASRGSQGAAVFDEGTFETVAEVPAPTSSITIDGLDPDTTYNVRVQAVGSGGGSPFAGPIAATTQGNPAPTACTPGGSVLCLLDDRFEVRPFFKNQFNGGATGNATAVPFSPDSGLYWFFNADNIELIVKMIDARTLTDSFWFFYGALTNVEYWITVTDTESGDVRTYYNPPNLLGAEADTEAFPEAVPDQIRSGTSRSARLPALPLPANPVAEPALRSVAGAGTASPCQPGPATLCLLDDRFEVTVDWDDPRNGGSGVGQALPLEGNDTTGTFFFFQPSNLELLVKVIDGRAITQHFWVFFGGLTDLPYTLRVRDTQTGNEAEYVNPFGDLVGETDTQALDPE